MARRVLAALLAFGAVALAGCFPPRDRGASQPTAAPEAIVDPAPACCVAPAVLRLDVEPKLPARTEAALIPERAVALIVAFEVGSPEVYTAKYQHPVWPGGYSGATIGIGYDLGTRTPRIIALDWETHPHHVRLQSAAGITGPVAREVVKRLADIAVDYELARDVFDQTSVIEHYRQARLAFGAPFARADPNVQGALTSLVFNRGGSMTGDRRLEMRLIRDECLPKQDRACIGAQLRAMKRCWKGSDIEAGMARRREAEARLAETG